MQRGIPYESILDAADEEKTLPVFAYILKQKPLQKGEAYKPKKGISPAFVTV